MAEYAGVLSSLTWLYHQVGPLARPLQEVQNLPMANAMVQVVTDSDLVVEELMGLRKLCEKYVLFRVRINTIVRWFEDDCGSKVIFLRTPDKGTSGSGIVREHHRRLQSYRYESFADVCNPLTLCLAASCDPGCESF